jgi:NAD(P)H-hydrate repair Nnr-like enzyme with NAD(P)H-hydrate dehydratase domain
MTGAASFTGESVLRAGAGLCYAAVPRSLTDVLGIMVRELVIVPMPKFARNER